MADESNVVKLVEMINTMLAVMPLESGLFIGAWILGLAIAIILHEVSHGWVAFKLGDPTAYYAGRLTLNPIKHVDLWGTIIVPMLLIVSQVGVVFGWAKPVPVNYYNLKYGKYGPLLVSLAGPGINLMLLIVFAVAARLAPVGTQLPALFLVVALINGFLMLFNLIPIPPLDGSKVLYVFLEDRPEVVQFLERYGFVILLGVIFLLPGFISRWAFMPSVQLVSLFSGFSIGDVISVM